jgi:hypothetical protein
VFGLKSDFFFLDASWSGWFNERLQKRMAKFLMALMAMVASKWLYISSKLKVVKLSPWGSVQAWIAALALLMVSSVFIQIINAEMKPWACACIERIL